MLIVLDWTYECGWNVKFEQRPSWFGFCENPTPRGYRRVAKARVVSLVARFFETGRWSMRTLPELSVSAQKRASRWDVNATCNTQVKSKHAERIIHDNTFNATRQRSKRNRSRRWDVPSSVNASGRNEKMMETRPIRYGLQALPLQSKLIYKIEIVHTIKVQMNAWKECQCGTGMLEKWRKRQMLSKETELICML